MQIQAIQSYNQQTKINQDRRIKNNPSFGSIKVENLNLKDMFGTPELARPFVDRVLELQNTKLNLREIVDITKLTDTGIKVLNNIFNEIGEKEVQDYTVRMILQDLESMFEAFIYEDSFNKKDKISTISFSDFCDGKNLQKLRTIK